MTGKNSGGADQTAWDAATPTPGWKDTHGRDEILMHPHLTRQPATPRLVNPQPEHTPRAETSPRLSGE